MPAHPSPRARPVNVAGAHRTTPIDRLSVDDLRLLFEVNCVGTAVFCRAALRHLPDDKVAVLGLVSTKWTALEGQQELRRRIEEASAFHPLEHLAIGTQCGFASAAEMAEQRMITEETQVDKLRRVAETARAVWG